MGRKKNSEKWAQAQLDRMTAELEKEEVGARRRVIDVLNEIGCQYRDEEDSPIIFRYNGKEFAIFADNEKYHIEVYCWFVCGVELIYKDRVEKLKRVVNAANEKGAIQMYYEIDKEDDMMFVHTKSFLYFGPEVCTPRFLLLGELHAHLMAQQYIYSMMDKPDETEEGR